MLVILDFIMLGVAIVGSLLWQAGMVIEEHSALFRRLAGTPIRDIARTRSLKVPSWISVASFHREHPVVGSDIFIITTRDGYDAGVVTVEDLYSVSPNEASYVSLGRLAKTISYVDALRFEDPILEAFLGFRSKDPGILSVLDKRGTLGGIVTQSDVDHWLNDPRIHRVQDAVSTCESTSNQKLAA
jgi:hypothetical protein